MRLLSALLFLGACAPRALPLHFATTPLGAVAADDPVAAPAAPPQRMAVGMRTKETSIRFALRTLSEMGTRMTPSMEQAKTGPALVEEARRNGVLVRSATAHQGDLVVFDNGYVVGVVSSVREDGTVEFLYAQHGTVRRGYVQPRWPTQKRDPQGRAWNTFVRPFAPTDPSDQRYLAGELLSGFIRTN